jgi:hypothetical protein
LFTRKYPRVPEETEDASKNSDKTQNWGLYLQAWHPVHQHLCLYSPKTALLLTNHIHSQGNEVRFLLLWRCCSLWTLSWTTCLKPSYWSRDGEWMERE